MIQEHPDFKKILFVMLFLIGITAFLYTLIGYASTPYYDEDVGIWRCLDWQFHECYAQDLNLEKCCNQASALTGKDIHYDYYPPFIHYPVKAASVVSGLPTYFWLSALASMAVMLLALVLLVRSGLISFIMYFALIPGALFYVFKVMPFTWVDTVACGSFPFLIAIALFVFLLFEWRKMRFGFLFGLFLLMAGVHNFGYVLNMFLILSIAFAWFILRDVEMAHVVAIIVTFAWIMVFANVIFPTNSVRIAFLLYFLVSFQVGRFVDDWLSKRKRDRH